MKTFWVDYWPRGERPTRAGTAKGEEVKALSKEDVILKLCERLHLSEEAFNDKYEIVDIKEVPDDGRTQ